MLLFSRVTVIALHIFNAVSATAGGIYLMTSGPGDLPRAWLAGFPSFYFPGVILLAMVGGSAAIAAIAIRRHVTGAALASITAGTIMVYWIVGEVASIRIFHPLQLIYLVTGVLAVVLTPREMAPAK
jgi:hypothetical protein